MKLFFLFLFLSTTVMASPVTPSLAGKVLLTPGCSQEVMVWLSLDKDNYQERLLLMHTLVPQGGNFEFYVNPGAYQIRASDQNGCEFFTKLDIKTGQKNITIKMVKK